MKRIVFYLSLLIIPVLFFLFLEGGLRLIGYGQPYALFETKGDFIRTRPDFPQKYFSAKDIGTPQVIPQTFARHKRANSLRLVCLGGSTTAGFPYEININFPVFIQNYLRDRFPTKKIEVVNLGISAINSFSVEDMLPSIAEIQPDMILIYMGHNEFYGAFGSASTESIGQSRALIHLVLALKSSRIYQLLQQTIQALSPSSNPRNKPKTLMQAMVGQSSIRPESALFKHTTQNFKANLESILSFWRERNVPVLLSNLISNWRDQPPLGADSTADSLFARARRYDRMSKFEQAQPLYVRAKDYDSMPFRAPEEFNRIIRAAAREEGIYFVNSESLFVARSPQHIPGSALFLEHLHPNAAGYRLLARAFLRRLLPLLNARFAPAVFSDATNRFTALDRAIGEAKISQLMSHPPFKGRSGFKPSRFLFPAIERLAQLHLKQGLYWDAAHLELGKWYLQHHLPDSALNEFRVILDYDSTEISALNYSGDALMNQRYFDRALDFYQKALALQPAALYLYPKIAKGLLAQNRNISALETLEKLIKQPAFGTAFNRAQKTEIHYLLALALAGTNRFSEARNAVRESLNLRPDYAPAQRLLHQLQSLK